MTNPIAITISTQDWADITSQITAGDGTYSVVSVSGEALLYEGTPAPTATTAGLKILEGKQFNFKNGDKIWARSIQAEPTTILLSNYFFNKGGVPSNGGGGGGQVNTVVGGTNVTVDSSDPVNPIVNATNNYVTGANTTFNPQAFDYSLTLEREGLPNLVSNTSFNFIGLIGAWVGIKKSGADTYVTASNTLQNLKIGDGSLTFKAGSNQGLGNTNFLNKNAQNDVILSLRGNLQTIGLAIDFNIIDLTISDANLNIFATKTDDANVSFYIGDVVLNFRQQTVIGYVGFLGLKDDIPNGDYFIQCAINGNVPTPAPQIEIATIETKQDRVDGNPYIP